jgi:hypothetical protein
MLSYSLDGVIDTERPFYEDGRGDPMTVTVVREEYGGHLVISAAGINLHLEASLETKDEIWLRVEPDEAQWQVLAQSDGEDPDGMKLILRRY